MPHTKQCWQLLLIIAMNVTINVSEKMKYICMYSWAMAGSICYQPTTIIFGNGASFRRQRPICALRFLMLEVSCILIEKEGAGPVSSLWVPMFSSQCFHSSNHDDRQYTHGDIFMNQYSNTQQYSKSPRMLTAQQLHDTFQCTKKTNQYVCIHYLGKE